MVRFIIEVISFVKYHHDPLPQYSGHIFHKWLDFISVAEDVSLTGGSAVQRIRLIDEEEQV